MTTPVRIISTAIKTRRVIEFRYKLLKRRVEPHTLGYDKRGRLTLQGWQLTGWNRGWRNYRLDKLDNLATTDRSFDEPRQGYNRTDPTLSQILARL